jgi:endogenous inhibitor of DNA gyrase (YacG/DUF329 family)
MANENKIEKVRRTCPFCDAEIEEAAFPYCEACGFRTVPCPGCGLPVASVRDDCPHCGADMKSGKKKGS